MSYKILTIASFDKETKNLIKKYRSIKNSIEELKEMLLENPKSGTLIMPDTYKIRLAIKEKNKGKSGGARVISHLDCDFTIQEGTIYLLKIYDKSEISDVSDTEIKNLINSLK